MMERASYQSLQMTVYVPGFFIVPPVIKALGLSGAMIFGCGANIARNAISGLATTRAVLSVNVVALGWARAIPYVGLKTANMQAGVSAGMAQGELQGCISNLQTVCRVVAPLLWSSLYSWGSARGLSNWFYFGVSALCGAQLLLAGFNDLEGIGSAK
jgi:hypothetical protein